VTRKLPDADEILTVLAARFVHDPEFEVRVNGVQRSFAEIEGRVSEEVLDLGAGRSATVIVIDSTRLNHSSVHQGIAFWVQRRLVGSPAWSIEQIASFDGRTRFARRYKVIIDTEGFEPGVDVAEDWTAFRATDAVRDLYRATADHVGKVAQDLAAEIVEAASEDALVQNRTELASLGQGARLEVAEFTKVVAQAHPTISPDFLGDGGQGGHPPRKDQEWRSLAAEALIAASGRHCRPGSPADRVDRQGRAARARRDRRPDQRHRDHSAAWPDDPHTDELHTLHPLILRSRWLFGPEFESQEYCSNVTLQTVARELFKRTEDPVHQRASPPGHRRACRRRRPGR
jgi:hypothetical protein